MRGPRHEDVAEVARRRLALLESELADLRRPTPSEDETGLPPDVGGTLRSSVLDLAGDGPGSGDPGGGPSWGHVAVVDRVADRSAAAVRAPGRHVRRRSVGGRLLDGLTHGLADRLPETLRGRVALGSRHVAWLVAVAGVALALTGWWALRAGEQGEPVPVVQVRAPATAAATPDPSTAPGVTPGASGSPSPGVTAPAAGTVVVDVAGRVRRPGVLTLPAGSRVHDAILRAGGPRRGVDLSGLNLARLLVDGEQVLVGVAAAPGAAASAVGAVPAPGALVSLNTATQEQLEALPGVGPVTAQSILTWRTEHGAFSSVEELLEVDGIGEKTLADLAPHVTL